MSDDLRHISEIHNPKITFSLSAGHHPNDGETTDYILQVSKWRVERWDLFQPGQQLMWDWGGVITRGYDTEKTFMLVYDDLNAQHT